MPKNKKSLDEELYIEKRKLGELFDSSYDLELNLWRGQKPEDKGKPILYPILKSFLLSNGNVRDPDIATYINNNELWVDSKSGGVSLFDKLGVPNKKWDYFRLSIGLKIPHGLYIIKDNYNRRHGSFHYSIKAGWDMPLKKFLMLLDEIATSLTFEER
ncbi:hypothetical protein [Sessilibacter corallicola]|uniref:Tse2 ADP-ribosyltransferase toxin domain-containing protein n=1 Tax=Sessilibacter corallicola TaxID=2904075 RepID=A0ABQ0A485_9GAMM